MAVSHPRGTGSSVKATGHLTTELCISPNIQECFCVSREFEHFFASIKNVVGILIF